jgi:hypothetical protein
VHYPTRILPETQPGTFTNLVYQYFQRQRNTSAKALATEPSVPETWFFLRGCTMNAHGDDGQQGWQKLFRQPDVPWPQFMDHVQVVAFAGNLKAYVYGLCS